MRCIVCGTSQNIYYCKKGENRTGFCEIHMPADKGKFDLIYKPCI